MAPRRPILFEQQYGLALLTAILLVAGVGAILWLLVSA